MGVSPATIDEYLPGQPGCKIPGLTSATVSIVATDPESGVSSVTVTWVVRRDNDPAVLDSGSSGVSSTGDDSHEATIGPFGDVLPGYGYDGTITVTVTATNGDRISVSLPLDLAIRDCS
ncbi:MAG: hypothetical protein GWP47_16430 [Actinobacteria bacterium]|nr:hypothetical protein [Actinomycetota bacterium]